MLWTEKMFGVKKPIITMLHLDPLPGDPRFHYGDTMERGRYYILIRLVIR